MEVVVSKNHTVSSQKAAQKIANLVREKPTAKLGLATGGSVVALYNSLVQEYEAGRVDFSSVSTVNLDEYVGVSPDNSVSYRYFMNENLFDRVNIQEEKTYVADGCNSVKEEILSFQKRLSEGGTLDLQLLGVGVSGHVGFNESNDSLHADVHIEKLDESTIQANARYFDNPAEVPREAFTMGVGDILKAKELLLIATGESKAPPIRELLMDDEVKMTCPVTLLKLHPNVTVFIDEELANAVGYKRGN